MRKSFSEHAHLLIGLIRASRGTSGCRLAEFELMLMHLRSSHPYEIQEAVTNAAASALLGWPRGYPSFATA